ncbi:MAG: hypothetical protein R3C70_04570 [Geminicoccaceae bacterium]
MALSDIRVTAWPDHSSEAELHPTKFTFLCAYRINVEGAANFHEAAFFSETPDSSTIWIAADLSDALVRQAIVAISRSRPPEEVLWWRAVEQERGNDRDELSALNMLACLFKTRQGLSWPTGFLFAGTIDQASFDAMIGNLESDIEQIIEETHRNRSDLIELAAQLGLSPQPSGKHPSFWQANCPGTHHTLLLNSQDDMFFCGYCKKKGSLDELRDFVAIRNPNKVEYSTPIVNLQSSFDKEIDEQSDEQYDFENEQRHFEHYKSTISLREAHKSLMLAYNNFNNLSENEQSFLKSYFSNCTNPEIIHEDSASKICYILDFYLFMDGKEVSTEYYEIDENSARYLELEDNIGGHFSIYEFCNLYFGAYSSYGEGGEIFGPFASSTELDEISYGYLN